ncbi:hypothetical protein A6R68_18266, partial [Neotoma lepida]
VDSYDVTVDEELGEIQLVKIEKRKYWLHDDWYLKYITLKTPHGDYIEFPCYRWITGEGEIVLRDGRGNEGLFTGTCENSPANGELCS